MEEEIDKTTQDAMTILALLPGESRNECKLAYEAVTAGYSCLQKKMPLQMQRS